MVADALKKIGRSGAFAVKLAASADDLHLEVTGVGRVGFPISKSKALALCRVAKPARHGLKDQTVLDPRVRDTWEIARSKIKIEQRTWTKALSSALERIGPDLGLGPEAGLRASLHNMLVYAPGQFFVPHQDSEKSDDMIGTLVVTLPSEFSGGEIVVQHHEEKVTFRGSGKGLGLIAFYADCHHEVRPVKSGYRIVLTYNLLLAKDREATLTISPGQLDALEADVRAFFRTALPARWPGSAPPEPPDRLVYLLDHQYSRKGLGWTRLKNADAARAAALREVARRLDCEIMLALADVHESWSCEDDYDDGYGYGRYRGRRRSYRYDDYESDDDEGEVDATEGVAKETPDLIELIDSSVELRHFVDARGKGQRASGHVGSDELCFTKPSVDLDPFQSEHEGYMGNWGNTVDRWYHRAAVVLWPRSRTFVIRAKTSAPWTVGEIAKVIGRKKIAEARTMVDQIVPFWSSIVRSEDAARIAGRMLQVSRELDDRALAGSLLRPFRVEHLTPKTAPGLVAVVEHYGLPWFEKACATFITSGESEDGYDRIAPDQRLTWLRGLPSFVEAVCATRGGEVTELASLLLARQWGWILGQYRGVAHFRPSQVLRELARLDAATLGVLAGSMTSGATPLHSELLTFLTSGTCPPRALVQLLKTAQETYDGRELSRLGLSAVHDHAVRAIEQELRTSVRSADDWSIRPPAGCSCALCKELARFLEGHSHTRLEWPLATEKRAHVHRRIDDAELPVTHTTLRSGRPYTLVLTKTRTLFEREAKARAAQQESLSWLTRTGRLFAPSARSPAAKEPLSRRAAAKTPRK